MGEQAATLKTLKEEQSFFRMISIENLKSFSRNLH